MNKTVPQISMNDSYKQIKYQAEGIFTYRQFKHYISENWINVKHILT
jgi:hypothetical protein